MVGHRFGFGREVKSNRFGKRLENILFLPVLAVGKLEIDRVYKKFYIESIVCREVRMETRGKLIESAMRELLARGINIYR